MLVDQVLVAGAIIVEECRTHLWRSSQFIVHQYRAERSAEEQQSCGRESARQHIADEWIWRRCSKAEEKGLHGRKTAILYCHCWINICSLATRCGV